MKGEQKIAGVTQRFKHGFTAVELVVVIVVIGVIAAIVTVSYRGVQNRANNTAAIAEHDTIKDKVEAYVGGPTSVAYPNSITDCPTPASGNICAPIKSGTTVMYYAFSEGVPYRYPSARHTADPAYELGVLMPKSFYYSSNAEMTSANEFVQYMDMAPIIDKYGIRPYKISFEIKSASTVSASSVNVYMQNGSGARYSFGVNVPVTTNFQHKTITVTPSGPNTSFAQSILAFYGTYSTGNRPIVRNVEITAG